MNGNELLTLAIIITPLIGAILVRLPLKFNRYIIGSIAVTTIFISFLSAIILFVQTLETDWTNVLLRYTWIEISDDAKLNIVLQGDPLGIFMSLVATGLGLLIALFSIEYMEEDKNLKRYWFFLQLFIFGMTVLVLAGDLILLLVGWEAVGLCSFGLISHWYYREGESGEKAMKAGIKAFLMTYFADMGLLFAIVLLFSKYKTIEFQEISLGLANSSSTFITIIGLLLFFSAMGKSAQFPFISWLSSSDKEDIDAMQGPTTVSALIHAATMVKAGVYLISRYYLLIPEIGLVFSWTIVLIAGFTLIISAISALTTFDLKRILAYSTISQLSYLFLSIGLGIIAVQNDIELSEKAFLTTQLHLISHALFKSLLFLTAGYIIHSWKSQNIEALKGVASWESDRYAFIGLVIGGAALVGIPPTFGFFSKDLIISNSYYYGFHEQHLLGKYIFGFAFVGAILTAVYTTRLIYYLVVSQSTSKEKNHHSSTIMKFVISILSILVLIGGVFGYLINETSTRSGITHELKYLERSELPIVFFVFSIVVFTIYLSFIALRARETYPDAPTTVGIGIILKPASQGYYLDNVYHLIWDRLKLSFFRIRYLHSGSLNGSLLAITIFLVIFIVTIVGGF